MSKNAAPEQDKGKRVQKLAKMNKDLNKRSGDDVANIDTSVTGDGLSIFALPLEKRYHYEAVLAVTRGGPSRLRGQAHGTRLDERRGSILAASPARRVVDVEDDAQRAEGFEAVNPDAPAAADGFDELAYLEAV
jgi:hypothetical protein